MLSLRALSLPTVLCPALIGFLKTKLTLALSIEEIGKVEHLNKISNGENNIVKDYV
jgi:hypothetical protein